MMDKLFALPVPVIGFLAIQMPQLEGASLWAAIFGGAWMVHGVLNKVGIYDLARVGLRARLGLNGTGDDGARRGDADMLLAVKASEDRGAQAVRILEEKLLPIAKKTLRGNELLVDDHAEEMDELRHPDLAELGVQEKVWHNKSVVKYLQDVIELLGDLMTENLALREVIAEQSKVMAAVTDELRVSNQMVLASIDETRKMKTSVCAEIARLNVG